MPIPTLRRWTGVTLWKSRAVVVAALAAGGIMAGSGSAHAQQVTWNFTQAHVTPAQATGNYGSGVLVAVLDTWIDASHPDFGGRVLAGADCVGGSCKAGLAPADNCEPHGTHVAGTVASASFGVAPSARILPVRVLSWKNNACTADSRDVARAVTWAADHGARIINISLGTSVPTGSISDVASAVDGASSRGILVVAAAGNEQAPVGDAYGASALVVAATGPSGQLASYSQRGNGVDLAAPGGDPVGSDCTADTCIVSTWSGHRFAAFAGTSMAAPHVAGAAALLWGQNPSRSRADVVSRLTSTAHPLANAGSGLLDAARALGVATPITPKHTPKPTVTATPGGNLPAGSTGGVTVTKPPTGTRPVPQVIVKPTPHTSPKATVANKQARVSITNTPESDVIDAYQPAEDRSGPIIAAAAMVIMAGLIQIYVRIRFYSSD